MTTIALRFPSGRYHATPWDRAVNEGAIEWPPSPWRLLRALYATWRWRAPDLPDDVVHRLLAALAPPPSYRLPRRSEAHTRHYMPDVGYGTDRVFDPFVAVDPSSPIIARWDVELDPECRSALSRLCRLVPYVGRAESLCDASLVDADEIDGAPTGGWCEPGTAGSLGSPSISLLAATVPLDLSSLLITTGHVRAAARRSPAGSRWVAYAVPPPETAPVVRPAHRPSRPAPPAALLRLRANVQPAHTQAVDYGHVLRRAALEKAGDDPPRVLLGKSASTPLQGHSHAHYLALDLDGDRLLDAVLVWAPGGLDAATLSALGQVSHLSSGAPGFRRVRSFLEASGPVERLVPSLCGPASRWVSVTPFAPYRHRKRETMGDYLGAEVGRELRERGKPPAQVRHIVGDWLSFHRQRPGKRPEHAAYGVELEFAEPVCGPLSLGALSHFGLGLFKPSAGASS